MSGTLSEIGEWLLGEGYILTALEFYTELIESGVEVNCLREYFSNPSNFERVSHPPASSQPPKRNASLVQAASAGIRGYGSLTPRVVAGVAIEAGGDGGAAGPPPPVGTHSGTRSAEKRITAAMAGGVAAAEAGGVGEDSGGGVDVGELDSSSPGKGGAVGLAGAKSTISHDSIDDLYLRRFGGSEAGSEVNTREQVALLEYELRVAEETIYALHERLDGMAQAYRDLSVTAARAGCKSAAAAGRVGGAGAGAGDATEPSSSSAATAAAAVTVAVAAEASKRAGPSASGAERQAAAGDGDGDGSGAGSSSLVAGKLGEGRVGSAELARHRGDEFGGGEEVRSDGGGSRALDGLSDSSVTPTMVACVTVASGAELAVGIEALCASAAAISARMAAAAVGDMEAAEAAAAGEGTRGNGTEGGGDRRPRDKGVAAVSPAEMRVVNFLIASYLELAGYTMTCITLAEEAAAIQDIESWRDLGFAEKPPSRALVYALRAAVVSGSRDLRRSVAV